MSRPLSLLLFPCLAAACHSDSMGSNVGATGDLGVTAGGSQDIGYAREIIEAGGVPMSGAFTAEGLFSEHDLPVDGPDCDQVLCPRAASARIDPIDQSDETMLIQVGFGTVIDAESFVRPDLDLALVVDVSCSMDEGDKMDAVHVALRSLADQLGPADFASLVAFDDQAELRLERQRMNDAGVAGLIAAIDGLRPRGSTDIEAGMDLGYDQIGSAEGEEGRRLMLFTDAQPNTGLTGMDSFLGMARAHAEEGIGLSAFGVGLDFGAELSAAIAEVRGGNAFYLADREAIETVFDTEFDYLVSPLAYDLAIGVAPAAGMSLAAGYGMPVDADKNDVALGASTLFLSSKSGGMGLTLQGEVDGSSRGGGALAEIDLSFETLDGEVVSQRLPVVWRDGQAFVGGEAEADDLGVFKMAGLLDEYKALEGGASFCSGDIGNGAAIALADEAARRLWEQAPVVARVDRSGGAALRSEAALMEQLAENLVEGSGACVAATW